MKINEDCIEKEEYSRINKLENGIAKNTTKMDNDDNDKDSSI
jgi:hypothetical protein